MEMRSGFGCDQSALVRQPRFSKTFHMLGTIFRSPKWRHDVVKIGQAKLRVELAQPCHQLVRFGDVARQCMRRRRNAQDGKVIGPVSQRFLHPERSIVVASSMEVCHCRVELPGEQALIQWTQTHGELRMLYPRIRLAKANLHPTAGTPGNRQVRIENQGALDKCHAVVKVLDHNAEGMPGVGEPLDPAPGSMSRPAPCKIAGGSTSAM